MNRNLILLFRLGGMLIEVICLIGLIQAKSRANATIAGIPLPALFWTGLVIGFIIWLIGTIAQMRISRIPSRTRNPARDA